MRHRRPRSFRSLTTGILASALALVSACGSDGNEANAAAEPVQSDPPAEGQVVDLASLGFNEGNDSTALFGVVEFADYGCVYCADFHAQSFPALHDEFVASGDVLWKYIPITIGGFPNGRLAGLSGVCGGLLDAFAAMRDRLYETRDEWMASDRGQALFVEYAVSEGMDAAAFTECLTGEEAAQRLDRNDEMARTIGVTGTPTFIIRGIPVRGAPQLAEFQVALRELSAEVREAANAAEPEPN